MSEEVKEEIEALMSIYEDDMEGSYILFKNEDYLFMCVVSMF